MTVSVEERPGQASDVPQPDVTEAAKPSPAVAEPVVVPERSRDEYATFDDLLSKPAREKDITIGIGNKALKVHIRAVGYVEYDRLQSQCPPTAEQRKVGLIYDDNTFGPKLISACVTRPKMDLDRATRLWNDPNWSGGEVLGLYRACIEICQADINVPFTETG